jgi:hypothetical protein
MIAKLKNEKGIDWYDFDNGKKYGSVIKKVATPMEKDLPDGKHIKFTRNVWTPVEIDDLKEDASYIRNLIPVLQSSGLTLNDILGE